MMSDPFVLYVVIWYVIGIGISYNFIIHAIIQRLGKEVSHLQKRDFVKSMRPAFILFALFWPLSSLVFLFLSIVAFIWAR